MDIQKELNENLKNKSFIVILNNITDIGNIGAIIRTCGGLGVDLIIANKFGMPNILNSADVIKASSGVSEQVKIAQVASLKKWIETLKKNNFDIIALDTRGKKSIESFQSKNGKIAIILGSEGKGPEAKIIQTATETLFIPMNKDVESFNVSVASAIAIYQLAKLCN